MTFGACQKNYSLVLLVQNEGFLFSNQTTTLMYLGYVNCSAVCIFPPKYSPAFSLFMLYFEK